MSISSLFPHRRVALAGAIVAVLALGGGITAIRVQAAGSREPPAAAPATTVDVATVAAFRVPKSRWAMWCRPAARHKC